MTKLNKEDGEVEVCTLLYAPGIEAEHIVKTFAYANEGDENLYKVVLGKLGKIPPVGIETW